MFSNLNTPNFNEAYPPISARPWEQVQLSALTKLTFPMVGPKGKVMIEPEELGRGLHSSASQLNLSRF
jgi:hypothetical protein